MARKCGPTDRDEGLQMPQIYYHKQLKAFADAIEPTPMQESWIANIIEVRRTDTPSVDRLCLFVDAGPVNLPNDFSRVTFFHLPLKNVRDRFS